ncbi:MAG TPA: glycosyltransferase family 4 protein [Solirubrobacteraceae bacterium]|nr:glycosyltransferase family 4 protein [Solirubrobacteraceae bacterium]
MPADLRPACLLTGIVSPYRGEPFRLLAEAAGVEVIAHRHAGPPIPGLTVHRTTEAGAVRLAASGRYRAVIAGLDGRIALPGAYAAARMRGVPFVLWATIWAHPRTPAHSLSFLPTRHLYRAADAVATYGPHVSRYVERYRGSADGVAVAPQAVDVDHFAAAVAGDDRDAARERAGGPGAELLVLYVGRLVREKGVETLVEAWRRAELGPGVRLALAGSGPLERAVEQGAPDARLLGHVDRDDLPALYAAADVLVLPSIHTASFREPWGLVVNEAMLQRTPVVASEAVGAAAGGLVRDGRNGFVVPAGDPDALAARLRLLVGDAALRADLGAVAREDAAAYTPAAWAAGMGRALAAAGVERSGGGSDC